MASTLPETPITSPPVSTTAIADTTVSSTEKIPLPPPPFDFAQSLADFNVSLSAYLATSPRPHGIKLQGVCVGAFVFDEARRLLLVQRAPHDSYPLRWEVPGGAADVEDETLLEAVARELWEETSLRARYISGVVGEGYTFLTRRPACVCKYSFVVDVEAYDVKVDPEEHADFVWVTEDQARAGKIGDIELTYTTKQQRDIILEAFKIQREGVEA
ncbi:NUDIX hydrolase domain-like protein [Xylaria bambusicola]|uniref:NUDIX hydrolase domain-like protein n=1 Tax=Xylaria bambusicola TaxID=326684 RepID=UPI0020089143|nr:NUDIX hydrolase domain-like protein [Xylaria bambusicola]KAI0502877.1 NUDIX hydrolase domain-like protein [Xylaria bambusicola]